MYCIESNSSVDKKQRRKLLRCSHCRPHRGENKKRTAKYGVKKPRRAY